MFSYYNGSAFRPGWLPLNTSQRFIIQSFVAQMIQQFKPGVSLLVSFHSNLLPALLIVWVLLSVDFFDFKSFLCVQKLNLAHSLLVLLISIVSFPMQFSVS